MKKKRTYLRYKLLAGVLLFMVFFLFWPNFQGVSLADSSGGFDILVYNRGPNGQQISTSVTGSTFVMRSKTQAVQLESVGSNDFDNVTWSVISGTSIAKVETTGTKGAGLITALKPGDATIAAEVEYKDDAGITRTRTLTCMVDIKFAILEDAVNVDNAFNKVLSTDERASLFTTVKENIDDGVQLALNFGKSDDANCTWSSGDEDVVTVEKGIVKAVGAGKTTITASYLPDDSTTVLQDTITVYVIPTVKGSTGDTSTNIYVHSDNEADRLLTDTAYSVNGGAVKDKIEWAIYTQINGVSTLIEESIPGGVTSDLIELRPSTPNKCLKTVAKAGIYDVYFFAHSLYEQTKQAGYTNNIDELHNFCSHIKLYVYGEFSDKTLYINKGDSFDIAEAFNVTKDVFNSMFSSTLESGSNVVTYVSSNLYGTANEVGDAVVKIKITDTALFNQLCYETPPSDGVFTVLLHVSDGITLDRSSVTLALGASLQLMETSGASDGTFAWTTSDATHVTVDSNGLIKGVQVTPDNQDVLITLTQTTSQGNIRRATCSVRVVSTVTDIKLSSEEVLLEVGAATTVQATFTPDISSAPITWITNDEEVISISPATDKKSVVIRGLKAGTAVITAVNTDNFVTASVTVKVLAPITSITLNTTELKVKLNQEVVKLKATYTPTNATSTELAWNTSNSAVATVDADGVVTLKAAGTTIITVRPQYNPHLVMAQCVITVLQSATGFTLNTAELTLEAGDTASIQYTMTPADATTIVTWRTMDTSIATVSSDGRVTARAPGKTYVVATTENGFTGSCLVIVTRAASGVTLDVYHLTVAVGDTYQMTATPNPATSTETTFTWASRDRSIATVNSSGKVTGVAAGETVITVKTKSGQVEYLYVTVYDQVTDMKLNYSSRTLVKGKKFTLKATFTPGNATNKKVTWSSSNAKIASVTSKGVVSGLRGGVAVITAVSEDGGHVATCIVTVKQAVTSITLNKSSYTLGIGKTIALKATVKSTYSSTQKLKWTSSNVKIATVNSKGVVTGKKIGTVTIKCSATDSSGEYATCKIRVVRQATKITLNKTTIKMLVGATTKIKATVSPSNASYKTVTWSTSDSKVASIDSNGNITALSVGSCKIYAKAKDNSGKKATCFVYVSKAVPSTGVTISEKDMILVKGTSSMLAYSITPNNTTDSVKFSSDNKKVATVSSTGRVSARKPGAATITIRTSSGKVGMINVTVVGLNRTSITVGQYERVELWVEEVTNGVKWFSENASIASVDNGSVVSRMKGTTRIVAIVDGIRLYCKVTVK